MESNIHFIFMKQFINTFFNNNCKSITQVIFNVYLSNLHYNIFVFRFVNNVKSVIRKYYLDGIDIDWEFPSWPLLNFKEKYGFSKLLETLRDQLPNSLLTTAVAAPLNIIDNSYDIYSLSK